MVKLDVDGDDVVVRMSGLDVVWTLQSEVRVPLASVRVVRPEGNPRKLLRGMRWPGAHMPGLITAGTFRIRGGRKDFWDIRGGGNSLVVECEGADWERIVVEISDPMAAAARIEDAIEGAYDVADEEDD